MLSPLKLSVIVCGAAAGLAVAPYIVKQVLPPEETSGRSQEVVEVSSADVVAPKIDLPVAAPAPVESSPIAAIVPVTAPSVAAPAAPAVPVAELQLAAPALPSPAPVTPEPELTLPSLAATQISSAMPTPSMTPAPTPRPTPSLTPEIPYRSEVETAQKLMKQLGINTGKIDGKLGPNTQAAVRDFQKKHSLTVSGDVDSSLIVEMEKAVAALATPTPAPEAKKVEISDGQASEKGETSISAADDPNTLVIRKKTTAEAAPAAKKPAPKANVDPGPVPTLQNQKDVRQLQEQLKLAGTYTGEIDGRWGDLTRAAMREFQEKAGIEVTGRPNKETWLAMHSGVVTPIEKKQSAPRAEQIAKAESKGEELEISSAASEPTSDGEDLVVNVNGDGVSDPELVEPLATPAAVSSLDDETDEQSSVADRNDSDDPKVKVSTPARGNGDTEKRSDLAVAAEDKEAQREKLQKEIESRRAQIRSVGDDYEVKKYAPKMLETVNNMVDDLKIETVSNNPTEARERLARIDKEIERAKTESMKKKATEMVASVKKSYDALKKTFPTRIKALSLKDEEQKALREELTELVAKVDLGFEAMEKDFKAGKYDPIFDNGADFRNTIDEINNKVADVYLQSKLDEKDTASKLSSKVLKDIKSLHEAEDHLEAAEKLDSALASTGTKKKS